MKLKTLIEKFLLSYEGVSSPATVKWYRDYLRPLGSLEDREVPEITVDDLRALYVELSHKDRQCEALSSDNQKSKESGYSPYTLHCFARSWRHLFKWAVEEGHLKISPAQRLQTPPLPDPDPKAISREDVLKLLMAAKRSRQPVRDEALLRFLADTNARVGGTARLHLAHLDLKKRQATVHEKGKGGNGKVRTVFFKSKTAEALSAWLETRPASEDNRVFLLSESGIYQLLERLADVAGIKGPHNPHSFRHGCALGMLEKGANLAQVSQLMGHSGVDVTVKFYGRFADKELQTFHERYSWAPDEEDEKSLQQTDQINTQFVEPENGKEQSFEWITVPQAITYANNQGIRVPRSTIINAANRGSISQAIKCGRDWLLPRGEFLNWLNYCYRPKRE